MWGEMRKCKVIPPKPGCKFNKHQTASDKVDDVDNQIHPQYEHLHLYYIVLLNILYCFIKLFYKWCFFFSYTQNISLF